MKKSIYSILSILVIALIVVGIWAFLTYCEWGKPQITIAKDAAIIGQRKTIDINLEDKKSGLRDIMVSLKQGTQEKVLAHVKMDQKGASKKDLSIEVIPRKIGLKDGEATLRISVIDYSLLHNTAVMEIKTLIDAVPPRISLLSTAHNVNPGGSCLAVFKISKPVSMAAVQCGDKTFPAYPLTIKNTPCQVCFFAVPIDVTSGTPIKVVAMDKGGNQAQARIPFYIRQQHRFRSDTVNLGADFLNNKTAEFQELDPKLIGKSPEEVFTYINSQVRTDNAKTIADFCRKTQPRQLWEGTFMRMKNAAPMALFGDKRGYSVNGAILGESVHMGIDLASTNHAPIEAANNGIVLFAERLGIYGNAVIIDHGMGVASLYGHMNDIQVKVGQQLNKGDIIGTTGSTGLAGGDHLHYSVMVGGQFVNPIEWWDPHWIRHNVENKLTDAADML